MNRRNRSPRARKTPARAAHREASPDVRTGHLLVRDGAPEPGTRARRFLAIAAHAVIALFGAALLYMVFGPHRIGDYFTETDFYGAYAEGARLIQRGVIDPRRYGVVGPGYELALALAGAIVRDFFLAAGLLSAASAVAVLLFWRAILAKLVDARVAFAAVAFMAVNATLFRYGYSATTDAFATMLQAFALWLVITRSGRRVLLAAGLAAGFAFLTRYNAIYVVPAGLAVIAWRGAGGRRNAALAFLAGFALLVLPWIAFSLARGGELGVQLHHNIAFEVFARPQGIVWDDYQRLMQPEFPTLMSVISRDPGAVLGRLLFNVVDHLRLDALELVGLPVALAALAGLALTFFTRAWRTLWPVGVAGVLLFLTLVPVFHSARYSLGLLPLYATLAGAAFALPRLAFPVAGGRVWLKAVLAVVPLALALEANVAAQRETIRMLPREVLSHAEVLRERAAPGDRVIARKGHLAHHAGVAPLAFPFADHLVDLATFAREHDARWLYVSWPEVLLRPKLGFLLDTTAVVPGLTARHVTMDHPGVLYEIDRHFGELPGWYANDTLRSYHTARANLLIDGNNTQALYAIAAIELQAGHLERARFYLDRLAQLTPDDFSTLLLLGDTALRQQDLDVSREAFARALALREESVAARVGLGWVELQGGRPTHAARWWRPVIEEVTDPGTLARMVQLFDQTGDAEGLARARRTLGLRGGGP